MIQNFIHMELPLADPVLKFLVILLIILIIPIISDKIKIPHLLGMIIAGVLIGPHGFNLLVRDSSIILSGTTGLLYIMFLAGLEIDMNDFKNNATKSITLGLYGFFVPMILGTLTGYYLLKFSLMTSVLLSSMFASHTLITYPIVSKLGISKNRAVNISVGSTLITNTLALLILAVIVGMTSGEIDSFFWLKLSVSFIIFTLIILYVFPKIARWFFKRFHDNVSQYIFVLFMVFLGAVLSKAAGIEAIIGAFLAGLALNRLIPQTSPLMNRIDFVGNAIFIPFFLIGVGMLIDYRAFTSMESILVALTMTVIATLGKLIAAWLTQKNFKMSKTERKLIFGLTNSQAAATLAAVLVGYNIVLGYNEFNEPIRLLNDSVLNGTIVMILVTCTIASFATQKSATQIALSEKSEEGSHKNLEKILIPVNNPGTVEDLVNISLIIKSKKNTDGLMAMNIIHSNNASPELERVAKKVLEKVKITAAAADMKVKTFLRYDFDVGNGITNVVKEQNITDLILGLHSRKGISDTFLGKLTDGILKNNDISIWVYHSFQPISTLKRHIVIVPENAEYETGFSFWLAKVWNIGMNTGAKIVFYAAEESIRLIRKIQMKHPIEVDYVVFNDWESLFEIAKDLRKDDNITFVLSRKNFYSYHPAMTKIPTYLGKYYKEQSYLLIYPSQKVLTHPEKIDLNNPSLIETIEKVDVIGKTIAGIFRKDHFKGEIG